MNKKKERIKYLVGIRNAIQKTETTPIEPNHYLYEKDKIKSVLATIDHLLAMDNIFPISGEEKQ